MITMAVYKVVPWSISHKSLIVNNTNNNNNNNNNNDHNIGNNNNNCIFHLNTVEQWLMFKILRNFQKIDHRVYFKRDSAPKNS